ncbi:MAG: DsrE family protein [Candidatus Zhuqueibacterota bacterium]
MKKIAYIVSKDSTAELLEESILAPLLSKEQAWPVKGVFFIGDGVYHLVKGSRTAKIIFSLLDNDDVEIYACRMSLKNRKLLNIISKKVKAVSLNDFYKMMSDVDHIISF